MFWPSSTWDQPLCCRQARSCEANACNDVVFTSDGVFFTFAIASSPAARRSRSSKRASHVLTVRLRVLPHRTPGLARWTVKPPPPDAVRHPLPMSTEPVTAPGRPPHKTSELTTSELARWRRELEQRSEERRVGKECRSRWS